MTTFQQDVPPSQIPRVIAAFVGVYQYQDQVPDPVNVGMFMQNPEGKAAFVQRKMREHMRDIVRKWEIDVAAANAAQAAGTKVDSEMTIT